MNILITGGKGFIGHNLVKFLKAKGHKITVVDNDSRVSPGFTYVEGVGYILKDVKELHNIDNLKIDAVVHLAATVSVEECDKDATASLNNNIMSTVSVLEFCKSRQIKTLIFASTAAVYLNKKNNYGLSKYICEQLVKQYEINSVILRFFNVYGPGAHNSGPYSPVIEKFIKLKKEGKPLTIYHPGNQTRDFVHVTDICRLIYNILVNSVPDKTKTFDVCTGKSIKIKKIAKLISENIIITKRDLNEVVKSESKDPYRIRKYYNWVPKFTIKKYLEQIYATRRN